MADQTVEVQLPASFATLVEKVDALTARLAQAEGTEEKGSLTPELTLLKADLAKVQDELSKANTALAGELAKSQANLKEALAEREKVLAARRRDTFIKRVHQLDQLPGAAADDFAAILEKCESVLEPKQFEKLNVLLSSWNAALAKSQLFAEIGRSEIGAFTGAEGELNALAKQIAADEKVTYQKGYALATERNPDLYKRYRAEKES